MRLILLGTAGGPTPKVTRAAPAQVLVVDGVSYLVDCGNGVARQLALASVPLTSLAHVFVTHHHTDHNADLLTVVLLAWASGLDRRVVLHGPPPIGAMVESLLAAHARDVAVRADDEGRPRLAVDVHEIDAPGVVLEDGRVRVTAAIVEHGPMAPALAYRFDAAGRSIALSGDTAPCDALVRLATGADVLVHEVMHVPSLDRLLAQDPGARRLREHLVRTHTPVDAVGAIAARAGVATLCLTHFVPGEGAITEEGWIDEARHGYGGRVIAGRDLLDVP
ncbi:MAG: MBL fold metallo-hydrolase [Acidobacteriota bacterium]